MPSASRRSQPSRGGAGDAEKPNILLIVSDDTGYGDLGAYLRRRGRGACRRPNLDRLADEGMMFTSFYAQPSCTPGRAAMQTGRIPNRSGMTTVAFQGQGGGLPAAEWTLASVLKTAGYNTYFTGKWHLGEADYALPNAQGYDEMKYVGLYHLNAYTYADPTWFPDMDPELRAMFAEVTKGALSGKAGGEANEEFKINGQYVNTPEKGVVGIPFFDGYVEKAALEFLDEAAKSDEPFFINVNFMKVHQPNMPARSSSTSRMSKSKYADSVVELDARIGHIMDKVDELGLDQEHARLLHDRQRRLAGRLSRRRLHAVPRHQGHRARGRQPRSGDRRWPGKIKPDTKSDDIVGGLDLMATFAAVAGVELPTEDREGKPIIFDSYDMTPVWIGTGKCERKAWFYFTENELTPGAARVGNYKAVFNLRGDNGRRPAAWPWTPTSAGRGRRSTSPPCRRSSTSGRIRRSATTSS